jgi:hypothetical protein
VEKTTTPLGDYCDIWDPEVCEFQDLDFLRLVDAELVEAAAKAGAAEGRGDGARAPHMFDILKIDRLADSLDGDGDAIGALESLGAALAALGEARSDEDHGLLGWIERARKAFSRAR